MGAAIRRRIFGRGVAQLARWAAPLGCALFLAACTAPSAEDQDVLLASAKAYLEAKNAPAAVIELKNVLRLQPAQAEARYLLGKSLLSEGDVAAAATELQKALELQHPQAQVLPPLAQALLALGEHARLIAGYAETSLADPLAQADLQTTVAAAYAARGDRRQARTVVDAVLKEAPQFTPAQLLLARLLAADRRLDGALAVVGRALETAPTEAAGWLLQARLLAASGAEPARVLEAYQRCVTLQPTLAEAQAEFVAALMGRDDRGAVGRAFAAMKAVLPQHPRTLYLEAAIALRDGQLTLARQQAGALLARDPSDPDALRLAGVVSLQSGDLDKAEETFANALQRAPGNVMLRRLLALTSLRASRPEQAIAALKPLLDKGAAEADLLAMAALAQVQVGDFRQATALYAAAAKSTRQDLRAREALAYSRLGAAATAHEQGLSGPTGQAQALSELESIVAQEPTVTSDLALISALMSRREYDRALKSIAALEAKQPGEPLPAMLRGRVALARGDEDGARAGFERVLAMAPRHYPAYAALALLDLKHGKTDAARVRFEALLRLDPGNAGAMVALAALRERGAAGHADAASWLGEAVKAAPSDPVPRVQLIRHFLRAGHPQDALRVADEGLALLPGEPALLEALGQVHEAQGDADLAAQAYRQWAAAQPRSPLPLLSLARAQAGMKDPGAAVASLERALVVRPGFLPALRALVDAHIAAGHAEEALSVARRQQKARPEEASGFALEGLVHSRRRQADLASAAYRRALQRAPSRSDLAILLHASLAAGADSEPAQRLATSWLKDHPRDAMFRMHLGELALGRDDLVGAETHFAAVTKFQPHHAPALNNLAWVCLQRQQPCALAHAEKANALVPDRPEFLDTLALALLQERQFEKAVATQQRAIALQPSNPALKLTLARLYMQSGAKARAREQLEQLAALGPSFPQQAQVSELRKAL